MNKIIVLDNLTIRKIAAGEIIERPSSIVKELVENSLDANSKNIIIEIENGGKTSIRITDDGDGIDEANLKLAFKRHSTSKLKSIDDLYNVLSLGFRGEALASISAVAKVEVLTKTKDAMKGLKASVEDGEIKSIETIGCPKGTTMIITDLFYNLPVRKKFLKSDLKEYNYINNLVSKLAIGNHENSFKLIKDKKTVLKTPSTKDLKSTIHSVLGMEYSKNIIPINYKDEYIEIEGFVSNNNLYRGNRNHQYIFVNNRYIENDNISKIIENKYRSLIPIGKYPILILKIQIDPKEIDVNIHPTKQEIEFVNSARVYDSINDLIENNIDLILRIPKLNISKSNKDNRYKKHDPLPQLFIENTNIYKELNDISVKDFNDTYYNDLNSYEFKNNDKPYNEPYINDVSHGDHKNNCVNAKEEIIENNLFDMDNIDIIPLGVVFSTYIVAEVKGQSKIIFIDQHAAHERVMYEKYKRQYNNEEINSQILIAPEIIEMTNTEFHEFMENKELFKELGFEIEEFGPSSIAIRSVPLLFGEPKVKNLFFDIIDSLNTNIKSNYDMKIDKIMKIACTNAIKSGDKIGNIEIQALFKDLINCKTPYTCPHGRPTVIEITKLDIEKQFLRII